LTKEIAVGTIVKVNELIGYVTEVCRDKAFDRPYGYMVYVFSTGMTTYMSGFYNIVAI
jgi:hypothetical protein